MTAYSPITPALRAELEARLSPGALITEPARLEDYAGDASCLRHLPEMVVCAHNVADVQTLLTLANLHRFPVTPRGGGSGLAGACLADRGGVVLSTRGLDAIRAIDTINFTMEVEAGAISLRVREAAAARGLFYPPDPAGMELSTIGGNAATDAGGPACVKYGTTRDYILGLEAVLPDGSLITTGVRTRKGVVGYDLTNLLVGCEGTLAVITALTLKLLPKPAATTGVLCAFGSMADAMRAVARVMAEGHLPSAIEFLDYRLAEGLYDKIVSIEMIEAVGDEYLDGFFAKCSSLLKPNGVLALQMITCPDRQFPILRDGVDFIQKHIFPGSLLVSQRRINEATVRTGDLNLLDWEDYGPHYARTLKLWREAFDQKEEQVLALGFDRAFVRKWRYYLAYCEAAFGTRHISVVHAVFSRPDNLSLRTPVYQLPFSSVRETSHR